MKSGHATTNPGPGRSPVRRLLSVGRWSLWACLALLLVSTALRGDGFASAILVLALVSVGAPRRSPPPGGLDYLTHPAARTLLTLTAVAAFLGLVRLGTPESIYHTPEVRARLHGIYDEKMAEWPVPFTDRFIATEFGIVHVVASGPVDSPPILLLHASGVGGWSWKYNVEALSQEHRTYAVDLIGDAGKSELRTRTRPLESREDQARLYAEIADSLGLTRSSVVGASEGGFIATNYALHYPERVDKLVLVGPMGYSGAVGTIARIMLTAFFPLRPLQESTFRWAFSESPVLQEDFGEWFRLTMTGTSPAKVAPLPIPAADRRRLAVPTLFILGARDRLVGDPETARSLVQDVPDVQVEVVDAGHLSAAEEPGIVNRLILRFLADAQAPSAGETGIEVW